MWVSDRQHEPVCRRYNDARDQCGVAVANVDSERSRRTRISNHSAGAPSALWISASDGPDKAESA